MSHVGIKLLCAKTRVDYEQNRTGSRLFFPDAEHGSTRMQGRGVVTKTCSRRRLSVARECCVVFSLYTPLKMLWGLVVRIS